jgi:hypothetical protein
LLSIHLAFLFLTSAQDSLPDDGGGQDIVLVEPVRSPWARPTGSSRFTESRIGDWRVSTWTDSAGDHVVRLQRSQSGDTIIYERWYSSYTEYPIDRAQVLIGNCATGDPVGNDRLPEPDAPAVRAALVSRLAWCDVRPHTTATMLYGFNRAFAVFASKSRLAEAALAIDTE